MRIGAPRIMQTGLAYPFDPLCSKRDYTLHGLCSHDRYQEQRLDTRARSFRLPVSKLHEGEPLLQLP